MAALAEAPIAEQAFPEAKLAAIRQRTTGLLFTSQIFGNGGTTAGLTVSSILAATMLGSSTWAGVPNSVRTLGAALLAVPLSAYMVRAGRRRGLVLGYAIGAAGAALCIASAVLGNFLLLLVGSTIFGGGYTSNLLSRYAAADVCKAKQRGKAISLVVWGATAGAVVGPNLIGPSGLLAGTVGVPALAGGFGVAVVTFGVAGLLVFGLLRPDPLEVARAMAIDGRAAHSNAAARPLSELLRQPGIRVALVTLMTSHLVMIGIMSMTPVYMHDHGETLQVVGLVISAHVTGMYVFSPVTGWLADRIGRTPVIVLSALAFLSAALLDSLSPAESAGLLGLGMFLLGLGWNLGFVSGSALLTDSVSVAERPRIQGLADMMMGVAAAIGSLGSGLILETHGFASLNQYVAALVVFPLLAIWLRHLMPRAIPTRS